MRYIRAVRSLVSTARPCPDYYASSEPIKDTCVSLMGCP